MRSHSLLALAIACSATINTASATSLRDSVIASVNYHPAIQAAIADKNAASHNIEEAEGGFLPQITASISTGHQEANNSTIRGFQSDSNGTYVNTADISLQQLIYDGGSTSSLVTAAEKQFEAAGHLVDERTQDIMLEAARVHLDVLRQQELVELAKYNVESHEDYVTDIREKADLGVVTSTDAHHAEARLALAYSTLLEEEESLLTASARYKEVIGVYPEDLSNDVDVAVDLQSQEQAVEFALQNNPTIAEAYSSAQAADANYKQTNAAFRPNVFFEVTSSVRDDSATSELSNQNGQSHDTFAGVTMEWDLYRGGSDAARREEAASNKISSEELMKLAQRDTREDVRTIWFQRTKLQERMPLLEDYSTSTSVVLEDYIDQFAVNRRSLLDLLDRQVESFRADSDLISATYDLAILNYELLHATGQIQDQF